MLCLMTINTVEKIQNQDVIPALLLLHLGREWERKIRFGIARSKLVRPRVLLTISDSAWM